MPPLNPLCPCCSMGCQKVSDDLSQCTYCSHVWQTNASSTVKYGKEYASRTYQKYDTLPSALMRAGFARSCLGERGTILDYGYGDGAFLKVMKIFGYNVFGYETHGINYGISEGLPLGHHYNLVCFFDSLEHLPDLPSIVGKIIADNIIISVPQSPTSVWPHSLPLEAWKHYKPGEHLHYFNPNSLELLMRSHGYILRKTSNFEDTLRGKLNLPNTPLLPNILTQHFTPKDPK